MTERFYRLFSYDDWANRGALASLKMAVGPPLRAVRFMGHIIGCEWLWLGRLTQEKKAVAVWPELSLDQCETQLAHLPLRWKEYLDGLTEAKLALGAAYVNTKGEPWTNSVEDILMHVVMHSAYHRGQIASTLRESGHTPAYTDFIHCVRQGFIV